MAGQVVVSQSASGDTVHIHIPRPVATELRDVLYRASSNVLRDGTQRLLEDLAVVLANLPRDSRPEPDLTPIPNPGSVS